MSVDWERVSRAGHCALAVAHFSCEFSSLRAFNAREKDHFGATPKPARETRALPRATGRGATPFK